MYKQLALFALLSIASADDACVDDLTAWCSAAKKAKDDDYDKNDCKKSAIQEFCDDTDQQLVDALYEVVFEGKEESIVEFMAGADEVLEVLATYIEPSYTYKPVPNADDVYGMNLRLSVICDAAVEFDVDWQEEADSGVEGAEFFGLVCSSGEMQTYTSFLYGTLVALKDGGNEVANNEVDIWKEGAEESFKAFGLDEPEFETLDYDVDLLWRVIWLGEEIDIFGDDTEVDEGADSDEGDLGVGEGDGVGEKGDGENEVVTTPSGSGTKSEGTKTGTTDRERGVQNDDQTSVSDPAKANAALDSIGESATTSASYITASAAAVILGTIMLQ